MQEVKITRDFPNHMFTVINDQVKIQSNPYILILIPSKDRNDLLFNCIDSLITHTSKKLTNINVCIIDTGSTQETIDEINEYRKANEDRFIISLEEHGYYNFAKNNNQAFDHQKGKKYDYVLFCNNDVQLLNDAVSHMLWTYENQKDVGTVGIRLHFEDGKVQHAGAFCHMTNGLAGPGHYGFSKVITGSVLTDIQDVPANTAAFLMMKAPVFESIKFSEEYIECFEDVQLNIEVGMKGHVNYCNMNAVAFHFESQSRNADAQKDAKQAQDLKKLSTFILRNQANPFIKQKVLT